MSATNLSQLDWRPSTDQTARQLRADVYAAIRDFFAERDVLEVETPIWSQAANTDPNINSLGAGQGYLRTSPEFPMKRLLAAGSGPIYEIGRVFRAAELGHQHNPEFTMLEWYRPGFSYADLMAETLALVQMLATLNGKAVTSKRIAYREAVAEAVDLDVLGAPDVDLALLLEQHGWYQGSLSRSEALDLLFSYAVAARLPADQLTLVYDFPACQCALARIHPEDDRVAMRFELLWGGVELANGYDELLETNELAQRLLAENQQRQNGGLPMMPIDQHLLAATRSGIDACAGVALGIDRLLMCLGAYKSLADVINFTHAHA